MGVIGKLVEKLKMKHDRLFFILAVVFSEDINKLLNDFSFPMINNVEVNIIR